MQTSGSRIIWIDVLKGIAILFVVIGHSPLLTNLSPKVFNVIFSFHIPLFFFISGYLFNSELSLNSLLRRRFNSLLKPYLFTAILIGLCYVLIKKDSSSFWYLFWTLYANGPNLPKNALHLWFLPHLFLVNFFAWILLKHVRLMKNSIFIQMVIISLLLIAGVQSIHFFWNINLSPYITNLFTTDGNEFFVNGLLNNPAYLQEQQLGIKQFILKGLPWSIDIVLATTVFFISGYCIKQNNLEHLFHKQGIALFMFALFVVLHCYYNYTIDLNLRRYDNLLVCTLLACTGIYLCMYSAYFTSYKNNFVTNALQYLGRYSLIIFIFHPIIQSKVYFNVLNYCPHTYIAFLPAFAAGIILPLLLNYTLLERFMFFRTWYYAK